MIFDPAVANRIFAGRNFGVWISSDAGAMWARWGPQVGMPNVPVFDLFTRRGKLFAFPHGRGALVLSNFDINNDATVSCLDASVVKAAFNVLADLNSDNIISIKHLSMISRQLLAGNSCPIAQHALGPDVLSGLETDRHRQATE